jgi:hypothetical protein
MTPTQMMKIALLFAGICNQLSFFFSLLGVIGSELGVGSDGTNIAVDHVIT